MRLMGVLWGLTQMVFLSIFCIVAILIYRFFGSISKWVKEADNYIKAYYQAKVILGKKIHWVWYYPLHIFFEAILSLLWFIVTPAGAFKDFTLRAIEKLS